jgi:hypothetical protein
MKHTKENLIDLCESKEGYKLYKTIIKSLPQQSVINAHPKTTLLDKNSWKTVCHNLACYAAWSLNNINFKNK